MERDSKEISLEGIREFLAGRIRENWGDVLDFDNKKGLRVRGDNFRQGFNLGYAEIGFDRHVLVDILFNRIGEGNLDSGYLSRERDSQLALWLREYLIAYPLKNMEPLITEYRPRNEGIGHSPFVSSFTISYTKRLIHPGIILIGEPPFSV